MILHLLFPPYCVICGKWGIPLCHTCQLTFIYIQNQACFYCEKISQAGFTHERCKRPQELDGVLAFVYYTEEIKKIIAAIKYQNQYSVLPYVIQSLNPLSMAVVMTFCRGIDKKQTMLQPVPLHVSKLKNRGFNQAELFAEEFSKISNLPICNVVNRVKKTDPQSHTSNKMARSYNITNAFEVQNVQEIKGKTIILVDDVVTTGSTLKELARTLKKSGATRVFAWCLARD